MREWWDELVFRFWPWRHCGYCTMPFFGWDNFCNHPNCQSWKVTGHLYQDWEV